MERTPECSFDNPLNITPQIAQPSCQKSTCSTEKNLNLSITIRKQFDLHVYSVIVCDLLIFLKIQKPVNANVLKTLLNN
jgi:hypothetical protein